MTQSRSLIDLKLEYEWRELKGRFVRDDLNIWICNNFLTTEELSNFKFRNGNFGLELIKKDDSRGYVFVNSLQNQCDYETRMQRARDIYEEFYKRFIDRIVIDRIEEIACFVWRKRE